MDAYLHVLLGSGHGVDLVFTSLVLFVGKLYHSYTESSSSNKTCQSKWWYDVLHSFDYSEPFYGLSLSVARLDAYRSLLTYFGVAVGETNNSSGYVCQ